MYQSIPSLTIPPGDPRGFAHSSCPWGRVFAPLSCPGVCQGFAREVLNQSKTSIILKTARFLLSLKQLSSSSFHIEIHPGKNFTGSRTKKTKLYSRFLLLRIYPDSPVHTSANTERIQICPVML